MACRYREPLITNQSRARVEDVAGETASNNCPISLECNMEFRETCAMDLPSTSAFVDGVLGSGFFVRSDLRAGRFRIYPALVATPSLGFPNPTSPTQRRCFAMMTLEETTQFSDALSAPVSPAAGKRKGSAITAAERAHERRIRRRVDPAKRKRVAVACESCKRRKQKVTSSSMIIRAYSFSALVKSHAMFALVEDSLVDMWTTEARLQWERRLVKQNRSHRRTYHPNLLSSIREMEEIPPIHVLQPRKAATKKSLLLGKQPRDFCEILGAICVRRLESSTLTTRFYWRIRRSFIPRTSSTTVPADLWRVTIYTRS